MKTEGVSLSKKQRSALQLAAQAAEYGVFLVCFGGNQFQLSGGRSEREGTATRSTLESLRRHGFLRYGAGPWGRGVYVITAAGTRFLKALEE